MIRTPRVAALEVMVRCSSWVLCLLLSACGPGEEDDDPRADAAFVEVDGGPADASEEEPSDATCGGCLCVDPTWSCAESTRVNQHGEAVALEREVGMLEQQQGEHDAFARMWYAFYPADEAPEDKPVLLLFNGGPYASTLLAGTGTGPLDAYGASLVENPASWTRFANLLYVDAADAGFSYSRGRQAGNLRASEDAEMFVRTLLGFLRRHPQLRDNRVGLVGESYGGARIAIMLDRVFGFGRFGARSEELERELGTHFEAVFGEAAPTPERIAEQFAYQVYIQGMIDRLPDDECPDGAPASYDCTDTTGLLAAQVDNVVNTFVNPVAWPRFFGHDLGTVQWLRPEHRHGVFRDQGETSDARMTLVLGPLEESDDYYVRMAFGDHDVLSNRTFVRTLTHAVLAHGRLVRTLLTDAVDDRVVITSQLPVLAAWSRVPGLERVVHDTAPRAGVARPGWMHVSFEGEPTFEIRTPGYEAGHMVPIRAGRELSEDVELLVSSP